MAPDDLQDQPQTNPDPAPETEQGPITPPCASAETCGCIEKFASRCMNCRRAVEGSMSRIGGRRTRKLRALEECSARRCVEFLVTVGEDVLRFHLASMAWWRFSAMGEGAAGPIMRVLSRCKSKEPGSGTAYMHRALRVLSPLTQAQLSVWFGFDNLYQAAALFSDDIPEMVGRHCRKCRLYRLGCTAYDRLWANSCTLWKDSFVQSVAAAIKKAGGSWHNPCRGIGGSGKDK